MASRRREVPFALTADNQTQAAFRQLRNEVNSINRLGRTVARTFGGAFGIAGFRELGRGLRDLVNDLDDLAKTARELEISLQGLEGLRFAGNILGIDENQLSRILARLRQVRNLAIIGTQDSSTIDLNRRAFESLGITIDTLQQGNIDQLLQRVTQGFGNIADEATRSAIASQLVGPRLARSFLRLQAEGSEGLNNLVIEGQRLSGVTEEVTGKAEGLVDVFTRANTANLGRLRDQLAALTPEQSTLDRFGQQLSQGIRNFEPITLDEFFDPTRGGILGALGDQLGQLGGLVQSLFSEADAPQREFVAQIDEATTATNDLLDAAAEIPNPFLLAIEASKQLKEEQRQLREQERIRQREIQASNRLLRDLESLPGLARQQQGTARTGTFGEFQAALVRGETQDPAVQELESILDVLRRQRTDQLLQSILDRIEAGALDNPVFS